LGRLKALTSSAINSISGEMSARIRIESTMSLPRFMTQFMPVNGVSQTATTGMPPTESTRP